MSRTLEFATRAHMVSHHAPSPPPVQCYNDTRTTCKIQGDKMGEGEKGKGRCSLLLCDGVTFLTSFEMMVMVKVSQ